MEEATAASQSMAGQAAQLNELMERFRIGGGQFGGSSTPLAPPAMPQAAVALGGRLGMPGVVDEPGRAEPVRGELAWGGYPGGLPVLKGEPLFPRRRERPAEAG